jgi:hypothetical protein
MCVNVHYIVLHYLIFFNIILHIYTSLSIHLYLHLHFSKKNVYTSYSQCKSLKNLHAQHWFKSS